MQKFTLIFIVFCGCAFPGKVSHVNQPVDNLYLLYNDLYKNMKYNEALQVMDTLIEISPDISPSLYLSANDIYMNLALSTGDQQKKDSLIKKGNQIIIFGSSVFGYDLNQISVSDLPLFVVTQSARPIQGKKLWTKEIKEQLEIDSCQILRKCQSSLLLTFIVEKNGDLSNIGLLKGEITFCVNQLIKYLENDEFWISAKLDGETVRQKFVIPIQFSNENN